jgi:hypothetical protein
MRRIILLTTGLFVMMGLTGAGHAPRADGQDDLLKVRESVWRAWFANDTKALYELVPPDTIVINSFEAFAR